MNKKILATLMLGGLLFSNTVIASASTQEVYNTPTKMIDNSKAQYKSTIRQVLPGNESLLRNAKAPTNSSNLDTSKPILGWGGYKAIAISKSTVMEDYISAKSRIYKDNGSLLASNFDEMKKASKVSATAETNNLSYEAYGNHTYKLAGYKDVYHETYKKY